MRRGELLSTISHLVGAALSLPAAVVLVVGSSLAGDAWRIVGAAVYGSSLLFLYLASTLYHGLRGRAKAVFKRLDHIGIFLLIAGTYTPIILLTLRHSPWGWSLLGTVWGLALVGITLEAVFGDRINTVSSVLYLVMGWLALVAFRPLVAALPFGGLAWLVAGGVLYTGGFVFLALRSIRWRHEAWHVFVLGGSACHFLAILVYVL